MAVYALSYDEPEAIEAFAADWGITFPLLSDPDSEIIERLGILNTLMDPDDHPWYGIPFPGTYVLDADGVITHKFFEGNLGVRASAVELLAAGRGEMVELASTTPPPDGEVEATIEFDGDHVAAVVRHDLVVRLAIPEGQHVYADPAPEGMVALTIEFDDMATYGLGTLRSPAPHDHVLDGTDEVFPVHDGVIELRQPVVYVGGGFEDAGLNHITISGTVRWQACDDLACRIPQSQRFDFTLPTERAVMLKPSKNDTPDMDFQHHFAQMVARRHAG